MTAALVVVFAALVAADLNRLDIAATLVVLALLFASASLVGWAYRRLPEEHRAGTFSRAFIRTAGVVSLIVASSIATAYWFLGWKANLHLSPFLLRHYRDLDFIPATFAQLLPVTWRSGFHQFYGTGPYCFPGPFWWESMRYLRAAIPAYAVVFFALGCAGRLILANARRKAWTIHG